MFKNQYGYLQEVYYITLCYVTLCYVILCYVVLSINFSLIMIFIENKVIKLFVLIKLFIEIDDFCKVFIPLWNKCLTTNKCKKILM